MSEDTLHKLAAIVSADVVGCSRLTGADEVSTLAAVESSVAVQRGMIQCNADNGLCELV